MSLDRSDVSPRIDACCLMEGRDVEVARVLLSFDSLDRTLDDDDDEDCPLMCLWRAAMEMYVLRR